MYRISVTTLEKFRRFITGASAYDTEEALIETIKGIFIGNNKTAIGGAFHKIIEGDYLFNWESKLTVADNIAFTSPQAQPALTYRCDHPGMIHEVPTTKWYVTAKGMVMISGRIDGVEGMHVHDAKTKFRSVDLMEYHDSYQWRYYLDMTGLNRFFYDLFEVKGFEQFSGGNPLTLPDVQFIPHEPYQCLRYPGMEEDCLTLLNEFMDYIEMRDFFHLLKPAVYANSTR